MERYISGCLDPTQATALLVIVLVSRMQTSRTGDNNFVIWKVTVRPTLNERTGQIFRSDRAKMVRSF